MQGVIAGAALVFSRRGFSLSWVNTEKNSVAFLLWHSHQPSQPKGQPTKTECNTKVFVGEALSAWMKVQE